MLDADCCLLGSANLTRSLLGARGSSSEGGRSYTAVPSRKIDLLSSDGDMGSSGKVSVGLDGEAGRSGERRRSPNGKPGTAGGGDGALGLTSTMDGDDADDGWLSGDQSPIVWVR